MTASRRLVVVSALLVGLSTFRPHAQEQSGSRRSEAAARRAAERDADGRAAVHARSVDAVRQLRQRVGSRRRTWRPRRRTAGRRRTAPGAAPAGPVPVSPARIARLKRFDMNWQAALGRKSTRRSSRRARRPISTASSDRRGEPEATRRRGADAWRRRSWRCRSRRRSSSSSKRASAWKTWTRSARPASSPTSPGTSRG